MSKTYPNLKKLFLFIAICLFNVSFTFGQTVISGMISDAKTKEPLVGISVQIKGKVIGTITDVKGKFSFTTSTPLPIQLVISSVGYKTQEYAVNSENASINISLEDQDIMGQEVVVSASRVEESVMKAAVTVEKMDLRAIRETTAPSFYDAIGNMKGVDLTTQGLLFKSVNMRGFGSTGNVRTVQMIDGMDNQAPGLNFSVDNIVGMPELDVESVELLPGAASALYGPNALNGIILMNSKSPFLYQGLSASVKSGAMVADNRDVKTTPFYDMSLRYAKAFNNKWAFKVNASYLGAQDWQATDYTNLNLGGLQDGTRGLGVKTDYDGQNIYGDEVQSTLGAVANGLLAPNSPLSAAQKAGVQGALNAGLIPASTIVSRTGYIERDLMDYNTKSLKLNGALHYRLNEKTELIGQVNYGYGTTVYSGTGRYGLRNFNITQAKLELKADNYVLRAYTTQERSGKSYLSGLAAINVLNDANPHATWFGEYLNAFLGARTAGQGVDQAHVSARTFADQKNFKPGTAAFNNSLEKYRDLSIAEGGSNFVDKTNMYHLEGFYNFKNEIKFAEILVGGNLRQYQLRSNGTLFADQKEERNGTIPISEFGGFVQAGKSLFKDHLKLTGSVRYDKNQNFEGQFTPRVSAVTSFGKQNIRLSYQTGFRIPTTQNQYIDLTTPQGTLIGGLPEFTSRYNLTAGIPRYILTDFQQKGAASKYLTPAALASVQSKVKAFVAANLPAIQSRVETEVKALVASGAIPAAAAPAAIAAQVTAQAEKLGADVTPAFALDALPKYTATTLQPERIQSWEIGYKGLVAKKLFIDAYYYQSTYLNFIGGTIVVVPTASANPALPLVSGIGQGLFKGYSLPTNTTEKITSRGWAIGLDYSLGKGYSIGTNIANNELVNFVPSPQQQYAGYNTPQYRYNLSFGKSIGSGDKFGFRATFKHQNAFTWEAGFVQPTSNNVDLFTNTTVPAFNTLDAQVSIKVPSIKSIVKVGGTNIGGNPFIQAYGSASVGSMYYVAVAFDELFNR